MKYAFDQFEIELVNEHRARLYWLGSKTSTEYEIFLKPKNWLETMMVRCPKSKALPNIVLKRVFKGYRVTFTKHEKATVQFVLTGWLFPISFRSKSNFYATEMAVSGLINTLRGVNLSA